MLVIRGAYIRGGLIFGGAYIRDFTVFCPAGVRFRQVLLYQQVLPIFYLRVFKKIVALSCYHPQKVIKKNTSSFF